MLTLKILAFFWLESKRSFAVSGFLKQPIVPAFSLTAIKKRHFPMVLMQHNIITWDKNSMRRKKNYCRFVGGKYLKEKKNGYNSLIFLLQVLSFNEKLMLQESNEWGAVW